MDKLCPATFFFFFLYAQSKPVIPCHFPTKSCTTVPVQLAPSS